MLDTEENVEEFHVPRLNESDGDSDREVLYILFYIIPVPVGFAAFAYP